MPDPTPVQFNASERLFFLRNNVSILAIVAEVLGTGDGATALFSGSITNTVVEPGTVVITDGTETFTDENGVLTGDAGGAGTVNYETGAFSLTFDANVTNTQDVTVSYSYLDIGADDHFLIENLSFALSAAPIDVNPATGAIQGARPTEGDPELAISGDIPVYPSEGWTRVANEELTQGDASATTFVLSLANIGIHSAAFTAPLDTGTPANDYLVITDGTETFTDAGGGVFTSDGAGSATINYETGAVAVTFAAAPTNGQPILASYVYLKTANVHRALVTSCKHTFAETNDEGRHYYQFDRCNQAECGARYIQKGTDCTTGVEWRADRIRLAPVFKADARGKLMLSVEGMGAISRGARRIPAIPSVGLLSADSPFRHSRSDLTITAKATAGDAVYNGRYIGGFEWRSPFSAEAEYSSVGDSSLSEVRLVAAEDSRTEFDFSGNFTKPTEFDWQGYLIAGTDIETIGNWYSRVNVKSSCRLEHVAYLHEAEIGDENDALRVNAKSKLMYGIPGGSDLGRDTTDPVGRLSFGVTK